MEGWDSEKLWAALKKIQLWSLICLQKQITYLTNDISLPFMPSLKWDHPESAWVFQMWWWLSYRSIRRTACIMCKRLSRLHEMNFIRIIRAPLYMTPGQEGNGVFSLTFQELNSNEMKADWHLRRLLFTTAGPFISWSRWGQSLSAPCRSLQIQPLKIKMKFGS